MTIRLDTLSNGMRVVTEDMPGLASASIGVWVMAGGRHEDASQNGIAHFLEHMAFKGTDSRTALKIAEEIEDVGGYLNAYTGRERTAYYARVLGEDVPLALDLIADILLNPLFNEDDIELERGVILQEIGQSLDTPDDVIFDWLQETAYPDQPMGRPILGPAELVKSFTAADLRKFVATHYSPDRMILAAAGAVNHDDLLRRAESLFGGMKKQPAFTPLGARFVSGERREVKDLEQAHMALALEAPDWHDDATYATQIFSVLFGGGMSSRLFQEAREKRGLCYSIFSQGNAWEDSGMFTIYSGTGGEHISGLLELVGEELARARHDITEAETARARVQLKAGLLMGLESPSSRAERLARSLAIWNRVPDTSETVAKVDAVDVAAVQEIATRIASGPATLALYGPVEQAGTVEMFRNQLAR